VRYAFTLSEPILLPAEVKKMELIVQRTEVATAEVSPRILASKSLATAAFCAPIGVN
jgi:hypothetical protein